MRETWNLARDLLTAPSKAVERLKNDEGLYAALRLYGIFLAASVLFYTLKPADFPQPDQLDLPLGVQQQGLIFWAKVQAWGPLLTAIWILFLGWFCGFFKSIAAPDPGIYPLQGRRQVLLLFTNPGIGCRLMLGFALGLLPGIPMLLYTNNAISKPVLGLLWLVLGAAMIPGLRNRAPSSWKPMISLVLSINVVNLAMLVPFAATVALRSANGYHALEMAMVFWTLGLGSYIIKRLDGISTSRAFAALFLSMLCQCWFVFTIYFLGLVPKDILKALMSV